MPRPSDLGYRGGLVPAVIALVVLTPSLSSGAEPARNLALGRPCVFSTAPNYPLTMDPGDPGQLTDGEHASRVGRLWTDKKTVGWQRVGSVSITVDLGEARGISGVAFTTAAGSGGVSWPRFLDVLVSDDGESFFHVGNLVALDRERGARPGESGYAGHEFRTEKLRTHGRYVVFVVVGEPFIFVDEVEVVAGDSSWIGKKYKGQAYSNPMVFDRARTVGESIKRRILTDSRALRSLTKDPGVRAALERIDTEVASLPYPSDGAGVRAVFPLNDLHRGVFRAQAAFWRGRGGAAVRAWVPGAWDPMEPVAALPSSVPGSKPELRVELMSGNDTRSVALNLSYSGDSDASLSLSFSGFSGILDPSWIRVREVEWTGTRLGGVTASALVDPRKEGAKTVIRVPAGLTRQLWLSVKAGDTPPGTYTGSVVLQGKVTRIEVPLVVRVHPVRFPARPTLHVGGFDYANNEALYDLTRENREALLRELREHFVDSAWATREVLPGGKFDALGALVEPPDTRAFDRWVKVLWPSARRYYVFVNVKAGIPGLRPEDPLFATKLGAWMRFWAGHLRGLGLDPAQLYLHLVDEPAQKEQDELFVQWAKPLRAAGTGIRIFSNPASSAAASNRSALASQTDELCANRPHFLSAELSHRRFFMDWLLARGPGALDSKALAFYSCEGPAMEVDPYWYYRLQAWTAWEHGATAMHFWSFVDSGGASSWNEYLGRYETFSPLFLAPDSVTGSKQMEAIREGVEDYEYLVLLRDAVSRASKRPGSAGKAAVARELLAVAAEKVAASASLGGSAEIKWATPKDRLAADQVRVLILEELARLRAE